MKQFKGSAESALWRISAWEVVFLRTSIPLPAEHLTQHLLKAATPGDGSDLQFAAQLIGAA